MGDGIKKQDTTVDTIKHTMHLPSPLGKANALLTTHTDARKAHVKVNGVYAPITKNTVANAENTPQ